jgi:hypothetical protein
MEFREDEATADRQRVHVSHIQGVVQGVYVGVCRHTIQPHRDNDRTGK